MEILTRDQALEVCRDLEKWIDNTALLIYVNHHVNEESLKDIADSKRMLQDVEVAIKNNFGEGICKN